MQGVEQLSNLCSKDPKNSFYSEDVSKDASCTCPPGQKQDKKKLSGTFYYKCNTDKSINNTGNSLSCDQTPYNASIISNFNGLTTNSKCDCPSTYVKVKTDINNKSYYTCSKRN